MLLSIKTRPGTVQRYRAGLLFTEAPTRVDTATLPVIQAIALRGDPLLIVEVIASEAEAASPAAPAAETARPGKAKKAAS